MKKRYKEILVKYVYADFEMVYRFTEKLYKELLANKEVLYLRII